MMPSIQERIAKKEEAIKNLETDLKVIATQVQNLVIRRENLVSLILQNKAVIQELKELEKEANHVIRTVPAESKN